MSQGDDRSPTLAPDSRSRLSDPPRTAETAGRTIPLPDRYDPIEVIGWGSFGLVQRVFDRLMAREVALKSLRQLEPEDLLLLKREFRALADVAHPHLVRLYDLEVGDGYAFFTMELVKGRDVTEALCRESGRPAADPEAIRSVFCQLADGLAALHERDKLHRDVKPPNALVDGGGRVVLLDFGLVLGLERRISLASRAEVAGTLGYMAPEQAWGLPIGPPADWYALGVMLYECLAGRRPFESGGLGSFLARQNRELPPPEGPATRRDPALAALAVELLAFEPERRPSGAEVVSRLRSAAHPATPTRPPASSKRPFVGRANELAKLEAAFARTREEGAVVVRIEGESGVGKSALVERFLGNVERSTDALVLSGRCHPRESVPFAALDAIVDDLSRHLARLEAEEREALRPRGVPALVRTFPVLGRIRFAPLENELEPNRADPGELRRLGFAALRELLERVAVRRPLVLWIDDLQWGDLDSVPFLSELLDGWKGARLLLLLSHRREEGDPSPFLEHLTRREAARTGPPVTSLPVGPLDEGAANELLERLLEGYVTGKPGRTRDLAIQTGGSPYLLVEIALHLREHDDLPENPHLLRILASRSQSLTPEARELLNLAAVVSRPLPIALLLDTAGLGSRGRPHVYELCQRAWLRATPDGERVNTYHARAREAILAGLDEDQWRAHHRTLAETIERSLEPDTSAVFEHFLAAGETERAIPWALRAAEEAAAALAFDREAELFERAYRLRGARPADWALVDRSARALAAAGRSRDAAERFEEAADAARRAGADSLEIVRLRGRAAEHRLYAGELERGSASMKEVLRDLGVVVPRSAAAAFRRAALVRARFVIADEVRRLAGATPDRLRDRSSGNAEQQIRLDLLHGAARGLAMLDPFLADSLAVQHLQRARRLGEPGYLGRALGLEAGFEAAVGGPWFRRRSGRLLRRAESLAARTGDPHDLAWAGFAASAVGWFGGRWQECVRRGDAAREILQAHGIRVAWEASANDLFVLSALAQLGRIRELAERSPRLLHEARQRGDAYAAMACLSGAEGLPALAAGDVALARAEVAEAGRAYEGGAFTSLHFFRLYPRTQMCLWDEDLDGASELDRAWPALRRAGFLGLDCIGAGLRYLRARVALAKAFRAKRGGERTAVGELSAIARHEARRIRRSSLTHTAALAAAVEAGLAGLQGDDDARARALQEAVRGFEETGMALYAALAQLELGCLLGGSDGDALTRAADHFFAAEGIGEIEGFRRMFLPVA